MLDAMLSFPVTNKNCHFSAHFFFASVRTFSMNEKKLIRKSYEYADSRDIVEWGESVMHIAFDIERRKRLSDHVEEIDRTNFLSCFNSKNKQIFPRKFNIPSSTR